MIDRIIASHLAIWSCVNYRVLMETGLMVVAHLTILMLTADKCGALLLPLEGDFIGDKLTQADALHRLRALILLIKSVSLAPVT